MKNYLFLLGAAFLTSCNVHEEHKPKPKIETPPTEPCENVSWASFPIITHGYTAEKFDTVIIMTYIKNSNFDSLVSTFTLMNTGEIYDKEGKAKSFSLPKEITSNFDMLIIIGKEDSYKITEVKTDWVPRMCQSFCGYECTITNFLVNGHGEGGNIILKNPDFEFPYESISRKRQEAKASSDYAKDGWAEQ